MSAATAVTAEPPVNAGAEPLVRFAGVRKSYDGRNLVVKDLDLEIARGEFLTLLGPVRLRQDHHPDDAGGLRAADQRADHARRAATSPRCRRTSAASAWCSRTTRCSRT